MKEQMKVMKVNEDGAGVIIIKINMDACLVLKETAMSSLAVGIVNLTRFTSSKESIFALCKWWGQDSAENQLLHTKKSWQEIEKVCQVGAEVKMKIDGLSGAMVGGIQMPEYFVLKPHVVPDGKARTGFLNHTGPTSRFPLAASPFPASQKTELHYLDLPIIFDSRVIKELRGKYEIWLAGRADTTRLQKLYAAEESYGLIPVKHRISNFGAELVAPGTAHKEWRSANFMLKMMSSVAGSLGLLSKFTTRLQHIGFRKPFTEVRGSHIVSSFSDYDLRVLMGDGQIEKLLEVLPEPFNLILRIAADLFFDYIRLLRGDDNTSRNVTPAQLLFDGQVIMTVYQVVYGPSMTPSFIELCGQTGYYWEIQKLLLEDAGLPTLPRHFREEVADTAHVPLLKAGIKNVKFKEVTRKDGGATSRLNGGTTISDSFVVVDRNHQIKQENQGTNVTTAAKRMERNDELKPRKACNGLDAQCIKFEVASKALQPKEYKVGVNLAIEADEDDDEAMLLEEEAVEEEAVEEEDMHEQLSLVCEKVGAASKKYKDGHTFEYQASAKDEFTKQDEETDDAISSGLVRVDMAYTKEKVPNPHSLSTFQDLRYVSKLCMVTNDTELPLVGISEKAGAPKVSFVWSRGCIEITIEEKGPGKAKRIYTFDYRDIAAMEIEMGDAEDKIHILMNRRPHVQDRRCVLDPNQLNKETVMEEEPTNMGAINRETMEKFRTYEFVFNKKHDKKTSVIPEIWLENDKALLREIKEFGRFLRGPSRQTWSKRYPEGTSHQRLPPFMKNSAMIHVNMMVLSIPEEVLYVCEAIVQKARDIKALNPIKPCRDTLCGYTRPLVEKTREQAKTALTCLRSDSESRKREGTNSADKESPTKKLKPCVEHGKETGPWDEDRKAWLDAQNSHTTTLTLTLLLTPSQAIALEMVIQAPASLPSTGSQLQTWLSSQKEAWHCELEDRGFRPVPLPKNQAQLGVWLAEQKVTWNREKALSKLALLLPQSTS